ncbi:MAG: hypothetical protein M0042_01245 [Nitrospiraceae bacterium]|nr:hypothetical protein [Nitrospiraceae bacterium]
MLPERTPIEELSFKSAALDAAMQEAGFQLALNDPDASRDMSFRARYVRPKGALFPRLQANLEYYLATHSFSLRINADGKDAGPAAYLLVKNYTGDLKSLLEMYFDALRRGVPLMLGEKR